MQTTKKIICLFILTTLIANVSYSQDVEIIGKLKVSEAELNNTADSVVVRLSDGTLGIREKSTLSEGLEKGFFSETEMNKLLASDGEADDRLGFSVSIDGDYAIIGASEEDEKGSDAGAAYIYVRSGTAWTEQAKLTASDGEAVDFFGYSVSIDGDYAIVGAYQEDEKGLGAGSAYIFVRSGTAWTEQAKLTASDGEQFDFFGRSVSVDGDYAIIGANLEDEKGSDAGAAYIFVRSGTSWTEQAKLTASDGELNDYFGFSVSMDGDYAIVGAYLEDEKGSNAGSAYIFVRSGTAWTEQAKLTASDGELDDFFGISVSMDGDYAIVGAYLEDEKGSNAGSAYIFVRSGTAWTEQAKLTASDGELDDLFGISVSIDGDYAIVGAYSEDEKGSAAGATYIFVRSGTDWTEQAKLTASDGEAVDFFGYSVSIDGDYAVVGAYAEDEKGLSAGAAYIYKTGIDQDGDARNELQSLSQSGSTVTLSNNGGSISINDADSDPNNEIQSWSTLPGIPAGFADGIDNVDNLGNHSATTTLELNNNDISGVNSLNINDAGAGEGINWTGTAGRIFVDLPNTLDFPNAMRFQNGSALISFESPTQTLSSFGIHGNSGLSASGAGTSMYKQLEIRYPGQRNYKWFIGHQASAPSSSDDDLYFYVERGSTSTANVAGYVQDNADGVQMNFTGQHRSLVNGINFNNLESEIESLEGLIVVADQNEYLSMSGGLKSGQEAILIDESLPVVSISSKIKDKRVFGVISSMEPENRHDAAGAFATPYHKEAGDQRMYINATGEGAIWVVDQGGSLESGDYIQTADVPGYGMKQEDDFLHNYTVAKITMDVNFEPRLVAKRQIKKTEQMVDGKTSSVNVLDDYGRIIWEPMKDQEGNPVLEYEYKVRYLKADGIEIDQKTYDQLKCDGKEVYRAAFVGCTYHCG